MRLPGLTLAIVLATVPTPAADVPPARPVEVPPPLPAETRAELNHLLLTVAPKAKPKFQYAAMTLQQARHFADVPPKFTWQAEYAGWFVFARPGLKGEPDAWAGIIFVEKGTNRVGHYRETW